MYDEISPRIRDIDGQRVIHQRDYDTALSNFYGYMKDEWVVSKKARGMNIRPGEGTRDRFKNTSKFELDRLLAKDNISVAEDNDMLQESYRIQSRIKRLIFW